MTEVALYCSCCTTFIAIVPAGSHSARFGAACPPCYFDEESGRPCDGPYQWVEYEHDDGTFELIVAGVLTKPPGDGGEPVTET